MSGVTIRFTSPADSGSLARLAALDSAAVPRGRVLVAEVDGELWAALSLAGGAVIADPFRPTADLVTLLEQRAGQLRGAPAQRRWWAAWTVPARSAARLPSRQRAVDSAR